MSSDLVLFGLRFLLFPVVENVEELLELLVEVGRAHVEVEGQGHVVENVLRPVLLE